MRALRSLLAGPMLAAALAPFGCASTPPPDGPRASASELRVPSWAEGAVSSTSAASQGVASAPETQGRAHGVTVSLGASEPEKKFSGKRIDLDVKSADIHDVCRLLAQVGHANIVVADDVKGTVTLVLKQVPWDQALDVVVRAKGFRTEREGSVIFVLAK